MKLILKVGGGSATSTPEHSFDTPMAGSSLDDQEDTSFSYDALKHKKSKKKKKKKEKDYEKRDKKKKHRKVSSIEGRIIIIFVSVISLFRIR